MTGVLHAVWDGPGDFLVADREDLGSYQPLNPPSQDSKGYISFPCADGSLKLFDHIRSCHTDKSAEGNLVADGR